MKARQVTLLKNPTEHIDVSLGSLQSPRLELPTQAFLPESTFLLCKQRL